jgi:1,4-alpha-glucan branching enzyme|tara:strand:- start:1842 stop:2045 length:204 start_codon:yes stop_codon:yes gene_type:complete
VFWNPPARYQWKHPKPIKIEHQSVRIYESHVGMAQEFGRVSSYRDYADFNLQRVKDAGYNVIQLMAI